jgi:hypothetical protein
MRSILIRLAHGLIQILLLYLAFRLCQELLERTFRDWLGYQEADTPLSLPPSSSRYFLPERASEGN